ncbi:MAG: 2Fe-2S iron-sulfur cluster-binding protein, partial [Vicinamibacteria bacterium]
MADKVKITVDGREVLANVGEVIIQATKRAKVKIPHFCYHSGLSIDGSCRICLVEIEKLPKLAIACATPIAEGMVVHTQSEKVRKAREGVMEFILINHPLDCPICDEAGECKLQEYAFQMAPPHSRFEESKRKLRKRVDLGKHVLFDEERCILCRRCTRFCREISKTGELGIFQRGDHSYIDTFPGKRLDNPYSLNTVDICPVGALTDKNFRFRIRPWFLKTTPSVCAGCSNGCNMEISHKDNRLYRFLPRLNLDVNGHWMCDYGRQTRDRIESDERLLSPRVREGGNLVECSWEEALARAALLVQETAARRGGGSIAGIASA